MSRPARIAPGSCAAKRRWKSTSAARTSGIAATMLAAIPASALKQVLLNLLRNASEALQPGQRLIVSVLPLVNVDGRNCLEIRFVDNGPGLPPDRARDPLSPRPSEKGGTHRGVGLSIVREILAKWGATLLCRSQPGTGTSFQVMIPLEEVG